MRKINVLLPFQIASSMSISKIRCLHAHKDSWIRYCLNSVGISNGSGLCDGCLEVCNERYAKQNQSASEMSQYWDVWSAGAGYQRGTRLLCRVVDDMPHILPICY